MFVLVRMKLLNHVDTQTVKRSKRYKGYAICRQHFKFGMLQEHENEVSLRKWSGGTAHLRTLEGTLPKGSAPWPFHVIL